MIKRMTNKDIRAILFDMDGVLFDSMKNHAEAWVRAMKENNLTMTHEDVYSRSRHTHSFPIPPLITSSIILPPMRKLFWNSRHSAIT